MARGAPSTPLRLVAAALVASLAVSCAATGPAVRRPSTAVSAPRARRDATPTGLAGTPGTPVGPPSPSSGVAPAASPSPPDPGRLPQTHALPASTTPAFRERMAELWRGVVTGAARAAMPAFFPEAAYVQVKDLADPARDFRDRLVSAYRLDVHAAHDLLGAGAAAARLVGVFVPKEWAWIPPGGCFNKVGYWHAPGSRLVYREDGHIRSFGVFSLISWRGEWYVVHLSSYDSPGTVDSPSAGRGAFGPPGGC